MWSNPQFPVDLVTFTEKSLMENFIFWALQVKMESFWSTISIWSLNNKPNIKTTIKIMSPVLFLKIVVWKIFCKLLSKHMWQISFLVKLHASIILGEK